MQIADFIKIAINTWQDVHFCSKVVLTQRWQLVAIFGLKPLLEQNGQFATYLEQF